MVPTAAPEILEVNPCHAMPQYPQPLLGVAVGQDIRDIHIRADGGAVELVYEPRHLSAD